MEKKRLSVVALALTTLLAMAPPAAHAADVSHLGQNSVQDFFQSSDPTGCIVTSVTLFGGVVGAQIPGGPANTSQAVFVNVFQVDNCSSTFLFLSGSSTEVEFMFGGNASNVTLAGPIELCDSSSVCQTFQIDLGWTSAGDLNRTISSNHFFCGPGCDSHTHNQFLTRTVSGSGTISNAWVSFVLGPSQFGAINSSRFNTVKP